MHRNEYFEKSTFINETFESCYIVDSNISHCRMIDVRLSKCIVSDSRIGECDDILMYRTVLKSNVEIGDNLDIEKSIIYCCSAKISMLDSIALEVYGKPSVENSIIIYAHENSRISVLKNAIIYNDNSIQSHIYNFGSLNVIEI